MKKIRLNVLGISYSQTQSGAYALVLNEEDGERRIPIIIGGFEAQSIAIQLEGLKTNDILILALQGFIILFMFLVFRAYYKRRKINKMPSISIYNANMQA